jgi:ERCC4-related helicase
VQAKLKFFSTMLESFSNMSAGQCPICLEDVGDGTVVAVLHCGHWVCRMCEPGILRHNSCCPMCRSKIDTQRIIHLALRDKAVDREEEETKQYFTYGSKLATIIQYINKVLRESDFSRLIIFIQSKRLTTMVISALKIFNISHAACYSNVYQRAASVASFKNGTTRLLLLSSQDSVSGLHLPQASHVILFHPFLMESEYMAFDYERQGIARAWRGGQEKEVKVVRFITRGTVEEELCNRRNYRTGKLTSMDQMWAPQRDTEPTSP